MTKEQCLKRAAECNRLAEATSDPDMKLYLMKLALTWMQSATEADEKGRAQQASYRCPRRHKCGDSNCGTPSANRWTAASFSLHDHPGKDMSLQHDEHAEETGECDRVPEHETQDRALVTEPVGGGRRDDD